MAGNKIYTIASLDDACFKNIFKYLSLEDRLISAQVCSRWSSILDTLRHEITRFDTGSILWPYTRCRLKNQTISELFQYILSKYGMFIKHIKYQENYDFLIPWRKILPSPWKVIIDACPELETIIAGDINNGEISSLAEKYHNLIDLRIRKTIDNCDDALGILFKNNQKLEFVELNAIEIQGRCLLRLGCESIKGLAIRLSSKSMDHFIMVSNRFKTLNILSVEYTGSEKPAFLEGINRCEKLEKLELKLKFKFGKLVAPLLKLDHLIELNLERQKYVGNVFLPRMCNQLKQLKSLNISDTSVTDKGLNAISNCPLEELIVTNLKISGVGLKGFHTLKHLDCYESTIFDLGILYVLTSCHNLETLDVRSCKNLTQKYLKIAATAISNRDNKVSLQIYTSISSDYIIGIQIPQSLELILESTRVPFDTRRLAKSREVQIFGDSCDSMVRYRKNSDKSSVSKLSTLPNLNDDCVREILRLLSVPERMKLEEVCTQWQGIVAQTWRYVTELDLSDPGWKYYIFGKSDSEIDTILEQILKRIGKYLTRIVLGEYRNIEIISKYCPNLKVIDVLHYNWDQDRSSMISFLRSRRNLIGLSTQVEYVNNDILEEIIKSNPTLKTIDLQFVSYNPTRTIQWFSKINFQGLEVLRLEFFDYHEGHTGLDENDDSDDDDSLLIPSMNEFFRILSRCINLKELCLVIDGLYRYPVLESIGACKNLTSLWISETNFAPIYSEPIDPNSLKLPHLKKLHILNCMNLGDTFFIDLFHHAQSLTYLEITNCDGVGIEGIRAISTLPDLETLRFSQMHIKGSGLIYIAGNTLRRLECISCDFFNEPVSQLLKNCPRLEWLRISNCTILNEKIIDVAFETIERRDNGISLQFTTDIKFDYRKLARMPPLLSMIFDQAFPRNKTIFAQDIVARTFPREFSYEETIQQVEHLLYMMFAE